MIPPLPVLDNQSSAEQERGHADCLLRLFSHLKAGQRKNTTTKTASNLTQFLLQAAGSELVMQALFLFLLLVWIDLTMKQRDASLGKAGRLFITSHTHMHTLFSSHCEKVDFQDCGVLKT